MQTSIFTIGENPAIASQDISKHWYENIISKQREYPKLHQIVFRYYSEGDEFWLVKFFRSLFCLKPFLVQKRYVYEDCFGIELVEHSSVIRITLTETKLCDFLVKHNPLNKNGEPYINTWDPKTNNHLIELDIEQVVTIVLKK
jgi:hypothetical protein